MNTTNQSYFSLFASIKYKEHVWEEGIFFFLSRKKYRKFKKFCIVNLFQTQFPIA